MTVDTDRKIRVPPLALSAIFLTLRRPGKEQERAMANASERSFALSKFAVTLCLRLTGAPHDYGLDPGRNPRHACAEVSRPKLGQLLLSMNACTREALMHAWEQKVLFGDRLGTNLLAGGHVDEKTLALTLGQQHNARAAYGEVLRPDPRVIRGLSRTIARRHNIVPHHRDENGVYLLMQDPHDAAAVDDAAAALSAPVIPVVVCEARMWTLLNEHYGVEMGLRPIDLDGATATLKRMAAEQGAPAPAPTTPDLVSEDDFHALYMRQEEESAVPEVTAIAADFDESAADAPLLEPDGPLLDNHAIVEAAFDETSIVTNRPGPTLASTNGALFDETDTEVFDLTPSMETEAEQGRAAPVLAEDAEQRLADAQTEPAAADAHRVDVSDRDVPAAAPSPEVEAAALASPQSASPPIASPSSASPPAASPPTASASSASPAADEARRWLPLPTAPAVIFDEDGSEKLDDALLGAAPLFSADDPPRSLFSDEAEDGALTFDAATSALAHVKGRSEIARIVIRYALTRFARAALMTVHPGNILGWEGIGEGISTARLSTFRLRRDVDSVFSLVAKTKAHYLGPLQRWPGNGEWVKHTGRQIPSTVAVFPVLVRGEVVNLFYGDNGHQQNAEGDVGELLILMQKISSSYESLLGRT